MPKIREYAAPELNFQEVPMQGYGELRGGAETARSFQRLGSAIETGSEQIYQRQAQEETSDLNADFSMLTAEVTDEIDSAVQDGSINSQDYLQKLQPRIDKLSDGISTPAARRSFERNAARLTAVAIKKASRGQAMVAGAKAQANVQAEINNYSSSLFVDPSSFQDNIDAMRSSIEDQVTSGALKAVDAEKLQMVATRDLAKGAVRGWARLDPDLAEKKLKDFQPYLSGDQMSEMQGYINQERRANAAEATRLEAAEKRAEKLKGDAWMEKNLNQIINGNLSTKTILSSPLKPREKMSLINAVERNAKDGGGATDPRVKNRIMQNILNGQITDVQQFVDQVGSGINLKDLGELNGFLAKTPEGEAQIEGEKRLFELAKKTLGNKDPMTGGFQTDADSEYNISRFMAEYQRKKQEMIKAKKPLSELVNPDSKDYFGFRVKEFKKTPQQILEYQAQLTKAQVAAQTSQGSQKRLKVVSPKGQSGTILEADKDKYLSQGFKVVD